MNGVNPTIHKQVLKEQERFLRDNLKPGDTLYTVERHKTMSHNGNSAYYLNVFIVHEGKIRRISREVSNVLGFGWSDRYECIKVAQYPDDFVYAIGYRLFFDLQPKRVFNHEEL